MTTTTTTSPMTMTGRWAVTHTESGMLWGLGATEQAAWADAERSARSCCETIDRDQCRAIEAGCGEVWEQYSAGGVSRARQIETAAYDCQVEGDQRLTIRAVSAQDAARQYLADGDWRGDDGETPIQLTVLVWPPHDDVPEYVTVRMPRS